jgi:hypothetical protein
MGVISNLLEPAVGAVLAKIVVLVALILFIQRRSAGPVPADRPRRGAELVSTRTSIAHRCRRRCATTPAAPCSTPARRDGDRGAAAHRAAVVPRRSTWSPYVLTLLGKYLCYAMLALAVDAIWGYCGILSLGHAAFFSLGGYAMGMYLMRQIGTRGVYGDPILPDFMVFLNWKALPWFWYGFDHFWFAAVMVVLAPGLLALASAGWRSGRASPASTCRSSPRR